MPINLLHALGTSIEEMLNPVWAVFPSPAQLLLPMPTADTCHFIVLQIRLNNLNLYFIHSWVNIINHHGSIVKRIVLGVQGQHPRWLSGDTLTVAEGCNIRVLYGLGSSTCTMHYDKIMKSCCHSEVTATVKCGSSKLAVAHSDGTIVLFVKNDETNSNKEAFHLEHVQTKSACKVC